MNSSTYIPSVPSTPSRAMSHQQTSSQSNQQQQQQQQSQLQSQSQQNPQQLNPHQHQRQQFQQIQPKTQTQPQAQQVQSVQPIQSVQPQRPLSGHQQSPVPSHSHQLPPPSQFHQQPLSSFTKSGSFPGLGASFGSPQPPKPPQVIQSQHTFPHTHPHQHQQLHPNQQHNQHHHHQQNHIHYPSINDAVQNGNPNFATKITNSTTSTPSHDTRSDSTFGYKPPQSSASITSNLPISSMPLTAPTSTSQPSPIRHNTEKEQYPLNHSVSIIPANPMVPNNQEDSNSTSALTQNNQFNLDEIINILTICTPSTTEDYTEHLYKITSLIYDKKISINQSAILETKLYSLMDSLPKFQNLNEPITSKLYLVIEKNFDIFIKISTNHKNVELATRTIRFLTNVIMSLNYWEIYNLLSWKPAIYHFLNLIHFDLNDCYSRFIKDYATYSFKQASLSDTVLSKISKSKAKRRKLAAAQAAVNAGYLEGLSASPGSDTGSFSTNDDGKSASSTPASFLMGVSPQDHDKFVSERLSGLTQKEKRKIRVDAKLAAHRIIKKTEHHRPSNKSSNYDPDVVHECQLPSADEPNKLCLRRFSRKYELIRHQETVHSKKKKLFKCFVCVKQNPNVGPRIFTRHDTLAKHIRVNHKISGKEAKAEVAYSKKHAEVVEEGDITVHVGRRKTKVDFELRAHMEKKKMAKETPDGEIITEDIIDSGPDSIESDEEMIE